MARRPTAAALVTGALAAALLVTGSGHAADRYDLARALLRLDAAFERAPLDPSARRAVHGLVDRAAGDYFQGRLAAALRGLDEATLRCGGADGRDARAGVLALGARGVPPVSETAQATAEFVIEALYEIPGARPRQIELALVDAGGAVVAEARVTLADDGRSTGAVLLDVGALPAGRYEICASAGAGGPVPIGRWWRVDEPWRRWATRAGERLAAADRAPAAAAALCRRRIELLERRDSEAAVSRWVLDPTALTREVSGEITRLEAGEDPYRNRLGEIWHALELDGQIVSCRIDAPPTADDRRRPLVIALHGAGGNEHLFMEGYGAGAIRRLARTRGLLVVSPSTYPFVARPDLLDDLLDRIAELYDYDARRVYLVGHSLGGIAATLGAGMHPARVTAASALAGMSHVAAGAPPILIVAADGDTMFPARRARELVATLEGGRRRISLRIVEGCGHVLIVNEMLEESIDWLLAQRRDDPPAGGP